MSTEFPADPVAMPLRPMGHPRSGALRWIINGNPFYLLSAVSMLIGCYALNSALGVKPAQLGKVYLLMGALHLYEFLVIALGLYLLVRRGIARDGKFLLLLEALFIADAAYLNAEVFTADTVEGGVVNLILLVLAAIKVGVIFAVVGLPLLSATYAFIMLELTALFAIPGICAQLAEGRNGLLPPLIIYSLWWLVGMLLIAHALGVPRWTGAPAARTSAAATISRGMRIIPFLLLLVHLCMVNYVYLTDFQPANLSPLLIGAALWVGHLDGIVSRLERMWGQFWLPVIALWVAALWPDSLVWQVRGVPMSPLRLTLLAATFVYVEGLIRYRSIFYAIAALACAGLMALGATLFVMGTTVREFLYLLGRGCRAAVPKTKLQWGIIAVVGAFILLGIGALISLRSGRAEDEPTGAPKPPPEDPDTALDNPEAQSHPAEAVQAPAPAPTGG